MKLLFDQNLSPALVQRLRNLFPDSDHVFNLGMDQASDSEISVFAAAQEFVIVTKDADYSEMLGVSGQVPKIIWIRKGNCSTDAIDYMLRSNSAQILELARHDKLRLLILF